MEEEGATPARPGQKCDGGEVAAAVNGASELDWARDDVRDRFGDAGLGR